ISCDLDLGEAAIDKQFRSGDVAAIVRREKRHRVRDAGGGAGRAEWNRRGNFQTLVIVSGSQQIAEPRRVGAARAYRIHANVTFLQVRGPGPGKRTYGGLRSAINAPWQPPFAGADGRIQYD